MAERSKERHSNPRSKNNSGDMAIATARENSKNKNKIKQKRTMTSLQKATAMRMADRRLSKNVNDVPNGKL